MPPNQACTACRSAKRKCVFTNHNQTRCDRCIRQGRECIAHISRQGRRPKRSVDVAPTLASHATCDGVTLMNAQVNSFRDGDMNSQVATADTSPTCFSQANFSSDINAATVDGLFHHHQYNINTAAASLDPIMTDPNISCDLIYDSLHNSINSASASAHTTDDLTLKQWIQGAITFIESDTNNNKGKAAVSTSYLVAALQIAVSLSEKLYCDDTENSSGDFRSNSIRIRLKGANASEEWLDKTLSNTERNVGEGVRKSAKEANGYAQPAQEATVDYSRMISSDQATSTEEHLNSFDGSRAIDYLSIDSVEIVSTESSYKGIDPTEKNDNQQLFSLGLVLYEIFSGGEVPPSALQDLASMDGAFASLSRLSLCEDSIEGSSNNKRCQGPDQKMGLCQLSCEYLNFMGVPHPLCDVLLNLLEAVYGDLGAKDSYTNMSDVVSDLKRMLDMPEFLQGIDTEKLSVMGMPLDEFVIPRKKELEAILSCYNRCIEGSSCEIAIIKGESGTGKSWLALRVGEHVVCQGGIVLNSKFDRMKQALPFAVLSSTFDQYCEVLLLEKESDWGKMVVSNLQSTLGPDACYLAQVIPRLNQLLGGDFPPGVPANNLDSRNSLNRLHNLLLQFVDVITTTSKVSVVLILDDMHWADDASVAVLYHLLRRERKKFFFLSCYRDDEMTNEHPFYKMIENVNVVGVYATTIKLQCMGDVELNQAMSKLLCLSPRIIRSLTSIVHKKTKGNPLFLMQLLLSLFRDKVLYLDLFRKRWMWDEDMMLSMKLPDNVAICYTNEISKLPLDVQSALHTHSMFGAFINYDYIKFLEIELGLELTDPLKKAEIRGLVRYVKGLGFAFCHDRIEEASYSLIVDPQKRTRNHLRYGRCLINIASETSDDSMFFAALNQINLGRPAALSEDYAVYVKYNLTAGLKASRMSAFTSAYCFFKNGIEFLRLDANHWTNDYELSLQIFEYAAKSALSAADLECLHIIVDETMKHVKSLGDEMNINLIVMSSLAYTSRIGEALELGTSILSQLGENIGVFSDLELLQQSQKLVQDSSNDDILLYPLMGSVKMITAMKILAQLQIITMFVNPSQHPAVIMKMISITLNYGLSPTSPIGFAYFASFLAKQGNIRLGQKYALISRSLLQRVEGTNEVAGECLCAISEVMCFVEPLLAANELRVQGENASIRVGDVNFSCLNRLQYCYCTFSAGVNLSIVRETISRGCHFMKDQEHQTTLAFLMIIQRTVLMLLSDREHEVLTTSNAWRIVMDNKTSRHMMHICFQDLYLSFLLSNHGCLEDVLERYFEMSKSNSPVLVFTDVIRQFYAGLASFQLYRQSRDSYWLDRGKKCKEDINLWSLEDELGVQNFQRNKFSLLEAEEYFCKGDTEAAREAFADAISYARSCKFVNEEALACELTAKFLLEKGDSTSSLNHFIFAHELYQEWGAVEKATQLFAFVSETFVNFSVT